MKLVIHSLLVLALAFSIICQVAEVNNNGILRTRIQQLEIERMNLNACQGDMRP